jgi:predicted ABC-type ATPase
MCPEDVSKLAIAAGREVLMLTRKYLSDHVSFAVETTLSGNGPLETMRQAREQGFHVSLVYVCLDTPERNVTRVVERTAKGGHFVPEEDVRRRYVRSLANLPRAIKLAHTAVLYDNADLSGHLVLEAGEGRIVWLAQNPPAWVKPIVAALS